MLPANVDVNFFINVSLDAIRRNPDLQKAERNSLIDSCIRAAQDGLLCDGKEAVLTIFNCNDKINGRDNWIQKVQYMPMIAGIRKKILSSGEVKKFFSHVVHQNDYFKYRLGDDESIEHVPCIGQDRGGIIAAYAIASTKDGEIYREVMSASDLENVRNCSKSPNSGAYKNFLGEMYRKIVSRRLAKSLPTSSSLLDFFKSHDEDFDFNNSKRETAYLPEPKQSLPAPKPSFEKASEEVIDEIKEKLTLLKDMCETSQEKVDYIVSNSNGTIKSAEDLKAIITFEPVNMSKNFSLKILNRLNEIISYSKEPALVITKESLAGDPF